MIEKKVIRSLKIKEATLNQSIVENEENISKLKDKFHEMMLIREAHHQKIEEYKTANSELLAKKENRELQNRDMNKKLGSLVLRLSLLERNINKMEFLVKKAEHDEDVANNNLVS